MLSSFSSLSCFFTTVILSQLFLLLNITLSLSPASASTSGLDLITECCNEKAQQIKTNKNGCMETDGGRRKGGKWHCVPYRCFAKSFLPQNNELRLEYNNTTRIVSSNELLFTFQGCYSSTRFPSKRPPKFLKRLDILNHDGMLIYQNKSGYIFNWTSDSYCIDTFSSRNNYRRRIEDVDTKSLYICMDISFLRSIDSDDPTLIIIYLILTSFGAFILLITMCCFIMTHEKQSIHGWTQFTHVFAFFMLMIFWNLDDSFILADNTGTVACKMIAIGSHFFYISLFSWLLIVNFDIRHAFENIGQKEFRAKFSSLSKYCIYSAFGWGVPFLVVCITLGFSIAFDTYDEDSETFYTPLYGIKGCSLAFEAYWLFLTLPSAILLIFVFILFIKMVKILRRQRKSSRGKSTTVLGVKILFLMGPFWFLDLITLIHVSITKDEFIWYITLFDMIVILQAIPLFVIYICRPDNLLFLQEKYPRLKNVFIWVGKLFCVPNTIELEQQQQSKMGNHIELSSAANRNLRANRRSSLAAVPVSVPILVRPNRFSMVNPPPSIVELELES